MEKWLHCNSVNFARPFLLWERTVYSKITASVCNKGYLGDQDKMYAYTACVLEVLLCKLDWMHQTKEKERPISFSYGVAWTIRASRKLLVPSSEHLDLSRCNIKKMQDASIPSIRKLLPPGGVPYRQQSGRRMRGYVEVLSAPSDPSCVPQSCQEPHIIEQRERNDPAREVNVSDQPAELLGSSLLEWSQLKLWGFP
jgi:hypothetical protein